MARRGERDRGKERFWRRVLRQWRRSELTIREFCVERGLAEPSFYAWRRTIAEREARRPPDRDSRARPGRSRRRPPTSAPPIFVPLQVTAAAALELVLGQGRVIRVPPGFDPATLRQLLAVLEEERPC